MEVKIIIMHTLKNLMQSVNEKQLTSKFLQSRKIVSP